MGLLSLMDKVSIVHSVMVDNESYDDAARKHKVSIRLINLLVQKVKKNPKLFDEMAAEMEHQQLMHDNIKEVTLGMIEQDAVIDKAEMVAINVKRDYDFKPSNKLVRQVFRQDLGMKYQKLKKLAYQGNSERSLILRQQFSMKMLELLEQGKRILNIDETWISGMKCTHRSWQMPQRSRSLPEKQVTPSISLILGMDTEGDVYAGFTQVNTNTQVMKLFISKLAM